LYITTLVPWLSISSNWVHKETIHKCVDTKESVAYQKHKISLYTVQLVMVIWYRFRICDNQITKLGYIALKNNFNYHTDYENSLFDLKIWQGKWGMD
jgi:hypothetical protein